MRNWKTARWFGRPWQDVCGSIAAITFLATDVPLIFVDATYVPPVAAFATAAWAAEGVLDRLSYGNYMSAALVSQFVVIWTLIGFGVHF